VSVFHADGAIAPAIVGWKERQRLSRPSDPANVVTMRCSLCDAFEFTGPVTEGAERARQHRAEAHPELAERSKPGTESEAARLKRAASNAAEVQKRKAAERQQALRDAITAFRAEGKTEPTAAELSERTGGLVSPSWVGRMMSQLGYTSIGDRSKTRRWKLSLDG
jgi:hypothetical protein